MSKLIVSRRAFLTASAAGASSLILSGCDQFDFLGQRDHRGGADPGFARHGPQRQGRWTFGLQDLARGVDQGAAQVAMVVGAGFSGRGAHRPSL